MKSKLLNGVKQKLMQLIMSAQHAPKPIFVIIGSVAVCQAVCEMLIFDHHLGTQSPNRFSCRMAQQHAVICSSKNRIATFAFPIPDKVPSYNVARATYAATWA